MWNYEESTTLDSSLDKFKFTIIDIDGFRIPDCGLPSLIQTDKIKHSLEYPIVTYLRK